jgi:pyruvate dehydrogenase E2 component (dihydrolipoamide acetyltransferase)
MRATAPRTCQRAITRSRPADVATDVIMPALGVAQDTGRVVRWLHAEGDSVRQNQPLIEVETDKVTVELEAPADGTLAAVTAHAGDDVTVGTVIALILAPGEAPPCAAEPPPGRPAASPVARRMAREAGVDLALLAARLGRPVQADDVRSAVAGGAVSARALEPDSPAPVADGAATPVSPAWRTMAERTLASWTTTPHFAVQREVNAGRLLSWQERARERTGAHITVTDLLVRSVAHALRAHPALNRSWSEGGLVAHPSIGVGLAVALDDGLVVGVIHDADTLDLSALAARREDLVTRAREGRLQPADVQGGTFTLSNLGMYGVDAFSAIINPPQAAILAVGRIVERVLPVGGMAAVQPALTLTLSCDHRAVDGARAGTFLRTVAETLEEPAALVS